MLLAAHKYNKDARTNFREASCEGEMLLVGPRKSAQCSIVQFQQYLTDPLGLALASTEANWYNTFDDHDVCY